MGYYIQAPVDHGKADFIAATYNGEIVKQPLTFAQIQKTKLLLLW